VIKPAIACTSAIECHASGVHPEAYPVVRRILAATKSKLEALIGDTPVLHQLQPEAFTDAVFGGADRHRHLARARQARS